LGIPTLIVSAGHHPALTYLSPLGNGSLSKKPLIKVLKERNPSAQVNGLREKPQTKSCFDYSRPLILESVFILLMLMSNFPRSYHNTTNIRIIG